MSTNVFMLMIEPAPYILGFIREIRSAWTGTIDVAFTGRNISQPWDEYAGVDEFLEGTFFIEVRRLWHRLKPDHYALVHLAGWSHPLTLAALFICSWRGIPVSIESDTPSRYEQMGWHSGVKRLIYPWLFRLPSLFLPGGSRQADYFRDYGVPFERIRIAQMTVDIDGLFDYQDNLTFEDRETSRKRLGLAKEGVAFLFVGRLENRKGIRELLEAYRMLRERSIIPCSLIIVGDGSLRQEVDEIAKNVPGIIATGRLAGSNLLDAYALADVFVLPSLFEPWGLVINEAMAFGLPVIVADAVGCLEDLVKPRGAGLVVPAGEAAALATAMQALVENTKLRQACSVASAEQIRPWTLFNEAERVRLAWQEVLKI